LIPLVHAQLVIPRGTADDPQGKESLAMLAATMFDKGTKRLDSAEFTEALEELGAGVAAGAGLDYTTVSLSTLSRTLKPSLKLMGELLTEPRWDADDWQRERELHMARLVQGPDDVNWIAARAFRALLYGPDHPYGKPADGTEESVKAVDLDDLKASHGRYVRPGGAIQRGRRHPVRRHGQTRHPAADLAGDQRVLPRLQHARSGGWLNR